MTDKQNEVYPHIGVSFNHNKKWNTNARYNMDDPWKRYAKWKEAVAKDYVLYDSTYIKYPGGKSFETESRLLLA